MYKAKKNKFRNTIESLGDELVWVYGCFWDEEVVFLHPEGGAVFAAGGSVGDAQLVAALGQTGSASDRVRPLQLVRALLVAVRQVVLAL